MMLLPVILKTFQCLLNMAEPTISTFAAADVKNKKLLVYVWMKFSDELEQKMEFSIFLPRETD